jgi:hypothetical protein
MFFSQKKHGNRAFFLLAVSLFAMILLIFGSGMNLGPTHQLQPIGHLAATYDGDSDPKLVEAGSTLQFATRCNFSARYEDFNISKLTVINDPVGAFDTPTDTNAVSRITIRYPDAHGILQTRQSPLYSGTATFSNLGFLVPWNKTASIEIYADISAMSDVGESLSGESYRLGIRDTGNSPSTFVAVGGFSSVTVNDPGIGDANLVDSFLVRKSVPVFANLTGLDNHLIPGDNVLYGFTVTAGPRGSVRFGRISFTIDDGIYGTGTLNNFRFFRGSTLISDADGVSSATATLHNGTTHADLSPAGGGVVALGTTDVIVSFNQEEAVNPGNPQTYTLHANVTDLNGSGNSVETTLALGDESADESAPVAGIANTPSCGVAGDQPCSTGNGNTGLIYDPTSGLFTSANDFFDTTIPGRAVVWSDDSASDHVYPKVNFGTPNVLTPETAANPASYDWTNGAFLKAVSLTPLKLTR